MDFAFFAPIKLISLIEALSGTSEYK